MPINNYRSLCPKKAEIIVSHDKRTGPQKHQGLNPNGACEVTHYRVDGEIITKGEKCDFILMNETKKIAYLIELKGRKVSKAVEQLEATANTLQSALTGYSLRYRIVARKCSTHDIESAETKKILKPWRENDQVVYKTNIIKEII